MMVHHKYGLVLGDREPEEHDRGEAIRFIPWGMLRAAAYHLHYGGAYSTCPSYPLTRTQAAFILRNIDLIIDVSETKESTYG